MHVCLTVLLRDDHAKEALLAHVVPRFLGQVPVLGDLVVVKHLAQGLDLYRGGKAATAAKSNNAKRAVGASTSAQQLAHGFST